MSYKLVYFSAAARAEASRIALHTAGLDWEDVRLTFQDFKASKEQGKYRTGLPLLILPDGSEVTQSEAIARFAGKKAGLYPADDDVAALKVDEIFGIAADALSKAPMDADPEIKLQKRKEYAEGRLKDICDLLESKIAGPFTLGDKLTVADLHLYFSCIKLVKGGSFDGIPDTYFSSWPKLTAFATAVEEHEVVKAYYKAHP